MTPKPNSFTRVAFVVLATVLQLSVAVAEVKAVKFDEKLKAPEASSAEDLKSSIREYFSAYARATSSSLAGIVRDKAAHDKWFDTHWRLQRAIDESSDLDLSEFGIKPKGDGSYTVDVEHFPQWTPLDRSVARLLEPQLLEAYTPSLKARGFRDQDMDAIRAYAQKTRPDWMARPAKLSLSESFAAKVEQRMTRNEKLETPQMLAYLYQNARIQAEADRAWTVGLLDTLDRQRQRILESYLNEQDRAGSMAIAPDDIEAAVQWMGAAIASGEHSRLVETERAKMRELEVPQ